MTTTGQNITMWSGDDKTISVTVNDENGAAQDITSFTASYVIAKYAGDTAIVTKTNNTGITLTTPASGILTIVLDAADTTSLGGLYHHELEITDTSSKVATAFIGILTINSESA